MALKIIPTGTVIAQTSHELQEKTLKDLAKKITELTEAGSATWSVNYSIPGIVKNRIEKFDLILILTMTMPIWTNYPNWPEKEQK